MERSGGAVRGNQRLMMKEIVEGPRNKGTASLLTRTQNKSEKKTKKPFRGGGGGGGGGGGFGGGGGGGGGGGWGGGRGWVGGISEREDRDLLSDQLLLGERVDGPGSPELHSPYAARVPSPIKRKQRHTGKGRSLFYVNVEKKHARNRGGSTDQVLSVQSSLSDLLP